MAEMANETKANVNTTNSTEESGKDTAKATAGTATENTTPKVKTEEEIRAELQKEMAEYAEALKAEDADYSTIVRQANSMVPYSVIAWKKESYPEEVAVRLDEMTANSVVDPIYNQADDSYTTFKFIGKTTAADGSMGVKGFVTDAIREAAIDFDYFYSCGPLPMLKALCGCTDKPGELSFEERMGCGFGACMGCSCKTLTGNKRICKEGPVMRREEIIW